MQQFAESFSLVASWMSPALVFIVGACLGSFFNVCIYRIPAGKSVVRPGSHCACGKPLAWRDNIPIFGWLLLRGRARCCGRAVSARYPMVELLTALLFLACWLLFDPARAVCGMVLVSMLICAAFIDADHFELPHVFTIGLAILGLVLSCAVPSLHGQTHSIALLAAVRSFLLSLEGIAVGTALVFWIAAVAEAVLKREAMGLGDALLVGGIGAFCGWQGAVVSIFAGTVLGLLWFVLMTAWGAIRGKKIQLGTPDSPGETAELKTGSYVPFGPMLAAGGAIYFLVLHRWVDPFAAEIAQMIWR